MERKVRNVVKRQDNAIKQEIEQVLENAALTKEMYRIMSGGQSQSMDLR